MNNSPDEKVAEEIVTELQKSNLIPGVDVKKLTDLISKGTMSIEAWNLLAEKAIAASTKEAKNA